MSNSSDLLAEHLTRRKLHVVTSVPFAGKHAPTEEVTNLGLTYDVTYVT